MGWLNFRFESLLKAFWKAFAVTAACGARALRLIVWFMLLHADVDRLIDAGQVTALVPTATGCYEKCSSARMKSSRSAKWQHKVAVAA